MKAPRYPFTALLDLLYPRRCAGCGGEVSGPMTHLCWDCLADTQLIVSAFCSTCGDPVEGRVEHAFECSACRRRRPGFDVARSAARYRGAVRCAIRAFKYQRHTGLAGDLAELLAACVRSQFAHLAFDAVTCVPLHPAKEKERTYNQSWLLAKALAARLRLPGSRMCVERIRRTPSQAGLKARERRVNVRGAFRAAAPDWVRGRRLLLVDDVMTTGATVGECAKALKAAGATGVYVVTVARG